MHAWWEDWRYVGMLLVAALLGLLVALICGARMRRWLRDHDLGPGAVDADPLPFGFPTDLSSAAMMLAHGVAVDPVASLRFWRLRRERRESRTLAWLLWCGLGVAASSCLGAFVIFLYHLRQAPIVVVFLAVTALALALAFGAGLHIQGWLMRHAPDRVPRDPFARSLSLVVAAVHVPAARHYMRLRAARGEPRWAGWLFWAGFGVIASELALSILWGLVLKMRALVGW